MKKVQRFENGQIMVLAMIVLLVATFTTIGIISGALTFKQNSKYSLESVQATNLAEAGIDKATSALNATAGSYNGESETVLGNGSYSVEIIPIDAVNKIVKATGYIPNKTNPKTTKTIQIQISKGVGVSFNYGVQVGSGGLSMSNNSKVVGSVYSNGNISMTNGAVITGDAYVAGGVQPTADQQNSCVNPNCLDFVFGKNVGGNNQLDASQSFRPSSTAVINKVALKLKKIGSPPNLTVRILGNTGSSPNKADVKTSGTLNASLVTNQYGWVEVAFSSTPTLTSGSTYWVMIDTSTDTNNYWNWQLDRSQAYTPGTAKWSPNYNASSPIWNNTTPLGDFSFQTYMGGIATSISGASNSTIGEIVSGVRRGDAHANTINSMIVTKDAYYQVQNGVSAYGASCSGVNSHCFPGSNDPVVQTMPISDGNIEDWKKTAQSGGIQTGDIIDCPQTLSSKKYVGNITLSNGCITTIYSPIWITGNLLLDNSAQMRLHPSYGASSGTIITDGTIKLSNNGKILGSGNTGSFVVALSNYDSTQNDLTAVEADNGSNSMILYAGKGKIVVKNNAALKEVTGWKLQMDNNSTISYDTGLASLFFSTGSQGAFNAIKGSYQIK